MAIHETKIDSTVTTSEMFPECCMYSVYSKGRNNYGGRIMLLRHRDIFHTPIIKLEITLLQFG